MMFFCMVFDKQGRFRTLDVEAADHTACLKALTDNSHVGRIEKATPLDKPRTALENLLDLYDIPWYEAYETGRRLSCVRKFHEDYWRTRLLLANENNVSGHKTVYALGSQNRSADWRLVRYCQFSPIDPNEPWHWRCDEILKGDIEEALERLTTIKLEHYPRFSAAGEPIGWLDQAPEVP